MRTTINPKRTGAGRRPRTGSADMDTRKDILLAARGIFARKGFDGASIREVARAARVNNAMIFYHFGDKIKLYQAVLKNSFAEFDRLWEDPIFSSDAPARAKIRTYVEGFIRFHQANKDFQRIMAMEFASCSDNYRWLADNYFVHNFKKLSKLLKEGMATGELRKTEPALAVPCFMGMIVHSFIMHPIIGHITGKKHELTVKRFGRFITDMFFDGLSAEKKRQGTDTRR